MDRILQTNWIDKMIFSVVIPVYNSRDTIERSLESCINQALLPTEIIIVDDNSSDASVEVINSWIDKYKGDVNVVLETLDVNSGPSIARNRGWDLAKGEYVSFLDADDFFIPEKLKAISSVLSNNANAFLLAHDWTLVSKKKKSSLKIQNISVRALLKRNLFATPTVTVKRNISERFDISMRFTEDHDLWLRITQRYCQTYYYDDVLTVIDRPIRSEGGLSGNLWEMRKGEINMYWKYCKANRLMVLFPMFLIFSLLKHSFKLLKGRS